MMELSLTRALLRRGSDAEPNDGFPPDRDTRDLGNEWPLWGRFSGSRRRDPTTGVGLESGPSEPAIDDGDF